MSETKTYTVTVQVAGPTLADVEVQAVSIEEAIQMAEESPAEAFKDHRMADRTLQALDIYEQPSGEAVWARGDAITGVWSEPEVEAEVHSDNLLFVVDFYANRWLVQATDEEILALARIEWHGDQEADQLAYYEEDLQADDWSNEEIRELLSYCRRTLGRLGEVGFEVSVDGPQVVAWLKVHRPELAVHFGDDGTLLEGDEA